MSAGGWIEIALYVALLIAITPVLGAYMARVYSNPARSTRWGEQNWKAYARSVLTFSAVSFFVLYVILRPRMPYDVALNTTASFVTNTNWQYYAGERTLSNLQQMAGLAVQNFASAAVGISVAIALIRALAARSGRSLGNFYDDLFRTLVFVLLPISVVVGLILVSQGVIQSLTTGPVASQEVIKMLGTNGGGFFNVNSAHPFENPTWLSNFIEMQLILAIPAALTSVYGRMVGNRRQGWAIFSAMLVLFVIGVIVVAIAENNPTPAMHAAGIDGFNMEGKEQRFGIGSTALFTVVTTVASCGAVNGAMEALTGIGGLVPMANMQTGEVIFGGVGSGLYGMLMFAILGVFLSGLMVGRTPEFLGKKIEAREIKLTVFGTIGVPLLVLFTSAIAIATKWGTESIYNSGPQGWSETLYAYTSQANNNGSAFAGYTGVSFADLLGGVAMIFGRFLPLLAVLAIAGSLVGKRVTPAGAGTFRTDSPTFVVVLVGVVVLLALLTFVPALLLGPVVQGMTDQLF
ncbi:MAG TPA: potassium-transporting ATPase subunit KdpA [Solirubrobacteraceae bacterium]|nr:potassium-transporting ATPase subunit KdpA [Solirubrobacteraceae bacterium]